MEVLKQVKLKALELKRVLAESEFREITQNVKVEKR